MVSDSRHYPHSSCQCDYVHLFFGLGPINGLIVLEEDSKPSMRTAQTATCTRNGSALMNLSVMFKGTPLLATSKAAELTLLLWNIS